MLLDYLYTGKIAAVQQLSAEELAMTLRTAAKFQIDAILAKVSFDFAVLLQHSCTRPQLEFEEFRLGDLSDHDSDESN